MWSGYSTDNGELRIRSGSSGYSIWYSPEDRMEFVGNYYPSQNSLVVGGKSMKTDLVYIVPRLKRTAPGEWEVTPR